MTTKALFARLILTIAGRTRKTLLAGLILAATGSAQAATLSEGFDNITTLAGSGWVMVNNSAPVGQSWFQGNDGIFPAFSGAPDSYIAANFLSASGDGSVSNWLLTPILTLNNGDTLSFRVRAAGEGFLDTLEVRLSTNGASSNVGANPTSVGDFSSVVGSYASDTDDGWVAQSFMVSGLAVQSSGRLAFRYLVDDTTINGNYLGIDSVNVTAAVPEPETYAMMLAGLGLLGLVARRRKQMTA